MYLVLVLLSSLLATNHFHLKFPAALDATYRHQKLADMDSEPWVAPPPRLVRLAQRLDGIAVELIEPVLKELSLDRVLQLTYTSAAGLPSSNLRWAIENSPSWKPIFRGNLERFRNLWKSLHHLAWFWNRHNINNVPFIERHDLWGTSSYLQVYQRNSHQSVLTELEAIFEYAFKSVLGLGWVDKRYTRFPWHQPRDPAHCPALSRAICAFVPAEVVAALERNDGGKLREIHQDLEGVLQDRKVWPEQIVMACSDEEAASSLWNRIVCSWDVDQLQAFLPHFILAVNALNNAKHGQLLRLAALHDTYPAWLKRPLAPQEPAPRDNPRHISDSLRRDASCIRHQLLSRQAKGPRCWYRFRDAHPALVPTDRALQLFAAHMDEASYPEELRDDVRRTREGFWHLYTHDGSVGGEKRCRREDWPWTVRRVEYLGSPRALPSPEAELKWLESLMRCVKYIAQQLPESGFPRPLLEPDDHLRYIASESARVIAEQLVADRQIVQDTAPSSTRLLSLVALYMPPYSSSRTREVSAYIWPDMDVAVRQLLWEDMIKQIKAGLGKAPLLPQHEDGGQGLACDATSEAKDEDAESDDPWSKSVAEYRASRKASGGKPHQPWTQTKCYICRMLITQPPHSTLKSMCQPCGEFNLAGASLSLPSNLNLSGKTALVTGGRVNLGFHTVMRLLRCGARVITSTRYPRDAITRYRAQSDVAEWQDRLMVVGADFRNSRDAFALVEQTKTVVAQWGGTLDILINNAAQTLTDSLGSEEKAVGRERSLRSHADLMLAEDAFGYQPRIRGGVTAEKVLDGLPPEQVPIGHTASIEGMLERTTITDLSVTSTSNTTISEPSKPSSWVQSLSEIPYEDIISAHSVNTFVPLILVRELLPIMNHSAQSTPDSRSTTPSSSPPPSSPIRAGYIVNVSSREGVFESRSAHQAKAGKHVHTNMSKAGLNMITETEASTAWKTYRVAMNTVDPGYMSAAPEFEQAYGGERPLGWEDGAGRVLWPVAMGERRQHAKGKGNNGGPLWGRFLKHYGAVRVDTRLGRG